MAIEKYNFEWKGNTASIEGDTVFFGVYFEYGVKNLRTGTLHTTLSAAIEGAVSGDTLRIQQECLEAVTIPADLELTIDLNGFDIVYNRSSVITGNTGCQAGNTPDHPGQRNYG